MTARHPRSASDPGSQFFEALEERDNEPLLETADGTLRFDLVDDGHVEHWFLTLRRGDVSVSHRRSRADAVVRIERERFAALATGQMNALAAALRGDLVVEGDLGLVLLFQRLFPAPPRVSESNGVPVT